MKRRPVPFFLVTGFLGSGKTTLLKHILDSGNPANRIAIIQNEFAPGSVDGTELKRTGASFELMEVNNGSVFCVCLLSTFVKSLGEFLDSHHPDRVILEASGLSDPISIAEMLQCEGLREKVYLAHIWCIVDAAGFEKLGKNLPRIQHQVRVADTVIINKTDIRSTELEEISAWIRRLNPFADIQPARFCRVNFDADLAGIPSGSSGKSTDPVALKKQEEFRDTENSGRPDIGACVIKTTTPILLENLESFLEETAPKSYRIKGFVRLENDRMMAVQSCFGDVKTEIITDYSGPTELIGMGPAISHRTFGRVFRYYQKLPFRA